MDGAGKIALGIVAAALLLVVGFVSYREFERRRDIAEAQELIQSLTGYAQQALQEGQRQSALDARQRAEARQRALDARRLAASERCVGGTVIRVEGASYTQALGPDGRPVACSGQYRR
ncbi:hypothetical protein LQ772_08070 [Frateuria edaphi]|uniref:hypothetical protein n=1 Tax=Frateuria edaphi TaxID=2898793 RepID=UPI001E5C3E46|nr:hypothetical protein [Frateuria edaphi]UGB47225.1 hypothetical protein LQ772_08070 [Frateuria edaphi]